MSRNQAIKHVIDSNVVKFKNTIQYLTIKDGYILPAIPDKNKNKQGLGGVLDSSFQYIKESEDKYFGGSYEFNKSCDYIDRTVIFLVFLNLTGVTS